MPRVARTHVLFDFFGTLVDYHAASTGLGCPRSHELLGRYGANVTYQEFAAGWTRTMAEFERASERDDQEFAIWDAATRYLGEALGRPPTPAEIGEFTEVYVGEWSGGVRYPDGIADFLRGLAGRFRLAVVSNTHHSGLVPGLLSDMGVTDCFDAVVLSVDIGWRKPHSRIYSFALAELGIGPDQAVFVGDTYAADYLGPTRAGMLAFLIDPGARTPVPGEHRLGSVFDLPAHLPAHLRDDLVERGSLTDVPRR